MTDKKMLRGDEWERHQEETAKKQAELKMQGMNSLDVGFGPKLLKHGAEKLMDAFMPIIKDMPEGMYDGVFEGHRVYIYRRKDAADIMLREDAVEWFGEESVKKIEKLLDESRET